MSQKRPACRQTATPPLRESPHFSPNVFRVDNLSAWGYYRFRICALHNFFSHILLLRLSPSLSCDGLFFGRDQKIPHLQGFNKLFLFTPYFLLFICCLTQTSSKPRLRPPHLFCNAPNQLNPTGRDSQHCILLQDWRAHPDCSKAGFCRTDQATTVVRLGRLSSADEMPSPPSLLKARGNLLD